MDADLYDEFGNYVGPELDSDDEEDEEIPYPSEQKADSDVRDKDDEVRFVLSAVFVWLACEG